MQRLVLGILLVLVLAGRSWAGFAEGVAAYEKGDYATALREFRPLAEQGLAEAQYNLGLMYHKGHGVPQDATQSERWYRQAAVQGIAEAQTNLGWMYYKGQGIPQDYAKALRWYRQAAAQGQADAQVNLGLMYRKGHGVPQDHVTAHMWYNLAAAQGDEDARDFRDDLGKQMTPAQLTEAQRLAREWLKAHTK